MKKAAPWLVLLISLVAVIVPVRRPDPSPAGFNLREFGRLPVLMDGRVQPIDSAGRNALLKIRRTAVVPLDDGRTMGSTEWMLEALIKPHVADERPIFPVHHSDLRRDLNLTEGAAPYYSFKQLAPGLEKIRTRAEEISETAMHDRRPADRQLLTLLEGIILYQRIKNSLQPNTFLQLQNGGVPVDYDMAAGVAGHARRLPAGAAALKAREHGGRLDQSALIAMMEFLQPYETVARVGALLFVPPANPAAAGDAWASVGTALRDSVHSGEIHPTVPHLAAMSTAVSRGTAAEFNRHVSEYKAWLAANGLQPQLRKSAAEVWYTRLQPSIKAAALYLLAVVFACVFWLARAPLLYRAAVMTWGLAFAVHTADVVILWFFQGRPPIATLYGSTIVAGWAAVLFGVGVESVRRNVVGVVTSALVGLLALVIGRHLMPTGDGMEAVRTTLNSSSWLMAHVGAMTLGAAAILLAGVIAAAYIVMGVLTRRLSPTVAAELDGLVYRLIGLAAIFNATGTMLGGFWADRVWGRFWGWDPKENAALLIIIWTAIYLLLRRFQPGAERTRMTLAASGMIVSCVSWLGVNMMSVGLHSYGFMREEFGWLMLLLVGPMVIVGLGLVPLRNWRSQLAQPTSCAR